MRPRWVGLLGALAAASCLVPDYEIVGELDDDGAPPGGEGGGTSAGEGGTDAGQGAGGASDAGGTSGKGGTGASGASGTSGAGGAAGVSGTGGSAGTTACGPGLTECDGDCVDTDTNREHCGSCDGTCNSGLVCLAGSCEASCGALTECDASCVDTMTSAEHCGGCNQPCLGECVAGECDLSCPNDRLRCGAVCCDAPPDNMVATCKAGACALECEQGLRNCGDSPPECFANDATHCGPDCTDCTQPNATAACVDVDADGSNDACNNTCLGYTFACAGVAPGKPACGSWDFESETTEGFTIWNEEQQDLTLAPSAFAGNFMTRTSFVTSGLRAMSADFDGDGSNEYGIQFRVPLCGGGQAVDLRGRRMTIDVHARTATGATPFAWNDGVSYFLTYNGSTPVPSSPGGDFNMASDEWVTATLEYPNGSDTMTATHVVFWFRVFSAWRGTVYIDNVRFE